MGNMMQRKQAILLNEPHRVITTGDFQTDLKAPAVISGSNSTWVRMCGKNLFDPNVSLAAPSDTASANTSKRIFTPFTYCKGGSWSNYYVPTVVSSFSVSGDEISIVSRNGYGVGFAFPLTAGKTYFLSAQSVTYGSANIAFYQPDGTFVKLNEANAMDKAFTVPSGVDITLIILLETSTYYGAYTAVFTGVQLEEASAATAFESYDGQTAYEPTTMTARRGLNSVLTNGSNVSIEYWKH